MVFFIFIQILIENYASKQWRLRSDAAFFASNLGLHYLHMSHKKDARHIWVKNALILLAVIFGEYC